ncbi:DUF6221 family protein [Amycolatopsis thermoflava]|uniref:DUF6221 family protein n=1 Tax=Amycolatopsis thermoflava TaxID=84480 RepID=UPI003F4A308E
MDTEPLITFLRARLDDSQRQMTELRTLVAEDQAWMHDNERPRAPHHDRPMIDLDAKRRIIDEYEAAQGGSYVDGLWFAVATLALPYADHPDYREEWRPATAATRTQGQHVSIEARRHTLDLEWTEGIPASLVQDEAERRGVPKGLQPQTKTFDKDRRIWQGQWVWHRPYVVHAGQREHP